MSMNLCFETKVGGHFVDFPFQTPTDLTYKMMGTDSVEERIKILKETAMWIPDDVIKNCVDMLQDNTLELTYM